VNALRKYERIQMQSQAHPENGALIEYDDRGRKRPVAGTFPEIAARRERVVELLTWTKLNFRPWSPLTRAALESSRDVADLLALVTYLRRREAAAQAAAENWRTVATGTDVLQ
jgi:hypothetical protein